MTAPTPSGRPAHAEPGNDGVSLLYLSLRGNMPEFYLNDVLIDPPPVDVDMMSDSPGTLQNDLLDWARQNGVTHIKDDDLVELDLVDENVAWFGQAGSPTTRLELEVDRLADEDEPDLVVRQGHAGDRYLIASDGLTDYVARDTVDEVLTTVADPGECADRLVALALRAGAPDNVTIVIGDLVDVTKGAAPPTQPQVVGAAAVHETGTRPIPTTPAAKAAALTRSATAAASAPTWPAMQGRT